MGEDVRSWTFLVVMRSDPRTPDCLLVISRYHLMDEITRVAAVITPGWRMEETEVSGEHEPTFGAYGLSKMTGC